MNTFFKIAQRVAAIFFTWSSIALAIYGICTLRFELPIFALVWYFIGGGLTIQSLRDIQSVITGEPLEGREENAEK